MKILGFQFGKQEVKLPSREESFTASTANMRYEPLFTWSYNGEKNLGEIGPIRDYAIDYNAVRARSWQSYLESEISQTVLNKYVVWVIGAGLKLQSEPNTDVLSTEKISVNVQDFTYPIESRWKVYSCSKMSDSRGLNSLNKIAKRAYKNAIIGGDVLVILNYDGTSVKVQLVDGAHVQQPLYQQNWTIEAKHRGNTIRNGIEIDKDGNHVAYYVQSSALVEMKRIPAYGAKSKKRMAYMVYGNEYRLDSRRGMPLISTVLETLAKLERYKEATVGSAEERQKIAYFIEHGINSTGESPLIQQMAKAMNADAEADLPVDRDGDEKADTIAATTKKMTFNMVPNSTLKMLESKNELYFKDFYTVNIDLVCAAIGIPPNVAMSKYDSNFSASRAALKDWEHSLNVTRADFAEQFYQPIYDLFLDIEILKNKVQAPGYLSAMNEGNEYVINAYRQCRFTGQAVPHIDPLKEVNAERAKLGKMGQNLPLTTLEQSTEILNGGDSWGNLKRYADELKESESLGIKLEDAQPPEAPPGESE